MKQLSLLIDRIISRVNINLQEFNFDTEPYISKMVDLDKLMQYYAFYGITSRHPLYFNFKNSNIAGSYFLGKCQVSRSAVYKSDIRGDELKRKGDTISCSKHIPLVEDEIISIKDSLLFKTLVHSNSHNPETPEEFFIRNTVAGHYSNIHGTTMEGCFLGPFATVDLMSLHSCIIGEFSYVQTEELFHRYIAPGTIWVENDSFSFKYRYPKEVLSKYISLNGSYQPEGVLYDFVESRKPDFERLFEVVHLEPIDAPTSSAVNRYAVVKGNSVIGDNVLISQRAYLENAEMGKGANAQEQSFIINSRLAGNNVTAHGAKIINSDMGVNVFVGFNSFLNGKEDARITVGDGCVVMPHTIIDSDKPIVIPDGQLVWGFVGSQEDLETQSISLKKLSESTEITVGQMSFKGHGDAFVNAFADRIHHILDVNGAFYEKGKNRGHAQDDQNISFNMIQPYRAGASKGIYPTIKIQP